MAYVNNSDRIANSLLDKSTYLQVYQKLFFHPLDLTVLNNWILLVWGKIYTLRFQTPSGQEFDPRPGRSQDRPTPAWLEGRVGLQQMLQGWNTTPTNTGQPRLSNSAAA